MSARRYKHDDPREWLNRARSSLQHAKATDPQVYLEELCFDAQQAAEKAVKAVLLHRGIPFPYVHDLDRLVQLAVRSGQEAGDEVRQLGVLNRYARRVGGGHTIGLPRGDLTRGSSRPLGRGDYPRVRSSSPSPSVEGNIWMTELEP